MQLFFSTIDRIQLSLKDSFKEWGVLLDPAALLEKQLCGAVVCVEQPLKMIRKLRPVQNETDYLSLVLALSSLVNIEITMSNSRMWCLLT